MMINLKPGERIDDLQRNNLQIIQDPDRFCFGMDAVLLSGFVSLKNTRQNNAKEKSVKLLDMCTGTGIIPILLTAKMAIEEGFCLEIQPDSADMARRSVQLNNLDNVLRVDLGDVKEASHIYGKARFDLVTCNPPYMANTHGLKNPTDAKAIARHEVLCSLEDVISQASLTLKPQGRFCMVHRPQRLAEIFEVLQKYRLEPKRMQLVYPYVDREPNMVLIEAVRGGKRGMIVEKPIIVYESPNKYTDEIYQIYGY